MKKLLYLLIAITLSCSSDGDASVVVTGCTDSDAVNYNPDATQSDGICFYSIVGDWRASYYTIAGQDILPVFSFFYIHVYEDSSFFIEAESIDGVYVQTTGVGAYNQENNTLTLTPDDGSAAEVWNLTYVDGDEIDMNTTTADGFHDTEWVRY